MPLYQGEGTQAKYAVSLMQPVAHEDTPPRSSSVLSVFNDESHRDI